MIPTVLKFEYKIKMRPTGRWADKVKLTGEICKSLSGTKATTKTTMLLEFPGNNMYGQDERVSLQKIFSGSKQTNIFVDIIY